VSGRERPPAGFESWLERVLPLDVRDDVVGDLAEGFHYRARRAGHAAARRWYGFHALTLPPCIWWGRRGEIVHEAMNDVRHALRALFRTPGFTAATLVTLTLAIGANAAIFSLVSGTLLRPLPYAAPERIVTVGHTTAGGDLPPRVPSSSAAHLVYVEGSRSFEAMALYETDEANLSGGEQPVRVATVWATASLFDVLGVTPALGRAFSAAEDTPGGPPVAVISDPLWREHFAGDPAVLGRQVILDGRQRTVIGVMPPGFAFPQPGSDAWLPMRLDPAQLGGFSSPSVARLRPGVSLEAAQRELAALLPRVAEKAEFLSLEILRAAGIQPELRPYLDEVVGPMRATLLALMATVLCVLAIACANVGNLLLVRAESRQRDVAVRRALGANRWRLLSQIVAESALLAVAGAAAGLALAGAGLRLLRAYGPGDLPRLHEVRIDWMVIVFTSVLALGVTVLLSVAAAMRQRRESLVGALRDGSRNATTGVAVRRAREVLVVAQVALALVLLVASGLMVRSFQALRGVDPGFRPEGVFAFRLSLPMSSYGDSAAVAGFHQRAMAEIAALPGVTAVGGTNLLPLSGVTTLVDPVRVEGVAVDPGKLPPLLEMRAANAEVFAALGVPLLEGRLLTAADSEQRTGAVLLSAAAARKLFPRGGAVGQRVAHGVEGTHGNGWSRVVGIVGDVRGVSLTDAPTGAVYYPPLTAEGIDMEWLSRDLWYVVRAKTPVASLLPPIRERLSRLDPTLPLGSPQPLTAVVAQAEARMKFTLAVLALAAGIGLVLGAVGLYGVMAYVTARRSREIGLRMALGAEAGTVRTMVVRQGAVVIAWGLAIGLASALALSRFLTALLYDVSAHDPLTYTAVAALLAVVGLLAVWLPARRAVRVSPILALRGE
jgi:putative ABC transport system permease protein